MLWLSPQAAPSGFAAEWRVRSGEWRQISQRGREFVGNGLDRSGIDAVTAMLYKIRIEYNTLRCESEQTSLFPTTSFRVSVLKLTILFFALIKS